MTFKKNGLYHIAWSGAENKYTGYGSSNYNILWELQRTKVKAHPFMDTGSGVAEEDCAVGVRYSAAFFDTLNMLPSPYRILYTMFETDKWPKEWVNTCNCANQIWVPSSWCKETLLQSGCQSPVEVVPLGVDSASYYQPAPGDEPRRFTFTFGYAGACTYRKGIDLLIKAFNQEFGMEENVQLLIRSSNALSSVMPNNNPDIVTEIGKFSNASMADWYQGLDCFVMPTRGEGFGLTMLEAMACGVCVAATNWGGQTDFLGDHSLKIAIDGLESCNGYHGSDGKWASPSLTSIRYCMRYAYEHREEIWNMGDSAAKYVAENWTYEHTARRIEELVKKINPKERVNITCQDVVVWKGDPRCVNVKGIGEFVRGVPRDDLTAEQISRIDFGDGRFVKEKRYTRE